MYSSRLDNMRVHNKRFGFPLRCVMALRFFLSTGSLGARSYPLSYVLSGIYYWDTGMLYTQTVDGNYWSSSIASSASSYRLLMYNPRLVKANSGNKRYGLALRCAHK